MKNYILYALVFILGLGMAGCQGYAEFPIDEQPRVKVDTNMFGIWKALEDTNRYDYFIIQTADDLFRDYGQWLSQTYKESANSTDEFVERFKKMRAEREYKYFITRMDKDGLNKHYEHFGAYPSKVGRATFINIPYVNSDNMDEQGFFFVRVLDVKHNNYLMTIAVVGDKSLRYMKSSAAVRKHIAKNVNNPYFYSDTLHLVRVSTYHESVMDSRNIANHREPPVE